MALPEGTVPVTVYMERKYVDRIDRWAEKLRMSRSKLAAMMLESGIESNGWAPDLVTSAPVMWVIEAIAKVCNQGEEQEQAGTVPAA